MELDETYLVEEEWARGAEIRLTLAFLKEIGARAKIVKDSTAETLVNLTIKTTTQTKFCCLYRIQKL
jgi:hypothetical protein